MPGSTCTLFVQPRRAHCPRTATPSTGALELEAIVGLGIGGDGGGGDGGGGDGDGARSSSCLP